MENEVRKYYGTTLSCTNDLRTSACCDSSSVPDYLKPLLSRIHPDVMAKYYGCGLVAPALLEGCRVLDLGCGAGRDVYLLAQLVGVTGEVVGVDMTPEQLKVAESHRAYHAGKFGFMNVRFLEGNIENLDSLPLDPYSFDIVVSNCVVNLSTDKLSVLRGLRRLLKPGGEFYFSDVYADRRVPVELQSDPILYGECLSGALYWNDFLRLSRQAGFIDPRLVTDRPLEINDKALAAKTGELRFFSATYRLFSIDGLEDACEDYGQAVVYKGTIVESPHIFQLDKHHSMETGRVFPVCSNTYRMLEVSRFASHFEFIGNQSRHYGLFAGCGGGIPFNSTTSINIDLGTATSQQSGGRMNAGTSGCC